MISTYYSVLFNSTSKLKKSQSQERERSKHVPFSMAIENVVLMHENSKNERQQRNRSRRQAEKSENITKKTWAQ